MSDDLLALLSHHDPVDADALRSRKAPEEELAEILADELGPGNRTTRSRRFSRPARLVAVAVASAILVTGAVALLPGDGDSGPAGAVAALESAAAIASTEASEGAGSPYTYYRVERIEVGTFVGRNQPFAIYFPSEVEEWVADDGSGRLREVFGDPRWPGPRDEERWRSSGLPPFDAEAPTDREFGPGGLNGRSSEWALPATRDLPADSEELLEIFASEAQRSSPSVPRNAKMFEYGTSVLLHRGAQPDLRAATYEAISRIDGVELFGEMHDPRGRPGTAVGIVSDYSGAPRRSTIIFDSETSHPLAVTEEWLEPNDYIDSLTLGSTTLEIAEPVESVRARPDAGTADP